MPTALGTATPSAFKVGTADCTAIYLGSSLVWPVAAQTTTLSDDFTGTTGAAPKGMWYKATAYPTGGPVTIQSNKMRVASGSAAAWSGAGSVFLGDPSKPEGNSTTGAPAIQSNVEYTFDYTMLNLSEHYPAIAFRARSAEMWPGGNGQNTFKTGYQLVLQPSQNGVDIVRGYDTATIDHFAFTFSTALKFRIKLDRKMLYVRMWPAASAEPSTWTYSSALAADESDGSIAFGVFNGPAAEQKYVDIDNFVQVVPVLSLGTTTSAPTTEPTGFTRVYTEDFNDVAPAGTGTSSFLNVYSNRIQPYDESSPNYQQRALLSAHDSVMDVGMNGTQGAAWVWGSAAIANSFQGGRFSMRAKTIGAFNNGPAIMIWPANNTWYEGEIDFPESVSGPGGTQGFQDAPWIHHHKMVQGQESQAQDVPLLVSWRDWHIYTAEWYPANKGPNPTSTGLVIYYIDNVEVYRTTTDVPVTPHRFMGQVGAYGAPGNMYIDWVTMATLN